MAAVGAVVSQSVWWFNARHPRSYVEVSLAKTLNSLVPQWSGGWKLPHHCVMCELMVRCNTEQKAIIYHLPLSFLVLLKAYLLYFKSNSLKNQCILFSIRTQKVISATRATLQRERGKPIDDNPPAPTAELLLFFSQTN